MLNKKKTTALLLGLTMMSGTAMAAPAEDMTDRLAALEAQQAQLAKEIKALRSQNKQLQGQVKSQKKSINGVNKKVSNELSRVQFSGFGRLSWDNDNIRGYFDRNDNSRTYLDLHAKFKVNDQWTFNFQNETNPRYKKKTGLNEGNVNKYHQGREDEEGNIQRIWAEGRVGAVEIDAGRRWRGLGFQNVLFGNESDGVVLSTPIKKTKLKTSAFYLSPTDKGYHFSIYGAGIQGQIGHGLQINAAYAKVNKGKMDSIGSNAYDTTKSVKIEGAKVNIKEGTLSGTIKGGGEFTWYGNASGDTSYGEFNSGDGFKVYYAPELSGTADVTGGTLTVTETDSDISNSAGSHGFVLSAMWNPIKNIFFIGDYVKTNAQKSYAGWPWGATGTKGDLNLTGNEYKAIRVNYRWSNINNPGSFQLYGRWFDYDRNRNGLVGVFGDKEWGTFQPGNKGWVLGFKYVPAKNVEWETMWVNASAFNNQWDKHDQKYRRHFVRTQVDYHF